MEQHGVGSRLYTCSPSSLHVLHVRFISISVVRWNWLANSRQDAFSHPFNSGVNTELLNLIITSYSVSVGPLTYISSLPDQLIVYCCVIRLHCAACERNASPHIWRSNDAAALTGQIRQFGAWNTDGFDMKVSHCIGFTHSQWHKDKGPCVCLCIILLLMIVVKTSNDHNCFIWLICSNQA